MGTKRNPGTFDGYAKAEPDEPMFTLLARDPHAPALVRLWADLRSKHPRGSDDAEKVCEAANCAEDMEEWYRENRS